MTTNNQDYPDFQGMGESFTPETDLFWEVPNVQPLIDAKEEMKAHHRAVILWQVWDTMRPVVEASLDALIDLELERFIKDPMHLPMWTRARVRNLLDND